MPSSLRMSLWYQHEMKPCNPAVLFVCVTKRLQLAWDDHHGGLVVREAEDRSIIRVENLDVLLDDNCDAWSVMGAGFINHLGIIHRVLRHPVEWIREHCAFISFDLRDKLQNMGPKYYPRPFLMDRRVIPLLDRFLLARGGIGV